MLELNLLSFGAHHFLLYPADPSPGVLLYLALFTFFLVEYLLFERVHLYTYDFVAERVGFKLGWGCFCFYPFFYAVGLWTTAELPDPRWSAWAYGLIAVLFFAGWTLARGANLQKYWFKRDPSRKAFGVIAQEALEGRVLVNGFWGLSRHINYLGELLMATALTLSLGHPEVLGPWLYPLYYVACWCRGSWTTTGGAPRSTARCGTPTGSACAGASFPSSTELRAHASPRRAPRGLRRRSRATAGSSSFPPGACGTGTAR
jgi:delta14-sterol reductase